MSMDARKPRLLVLNGTCLDVVRENGFWLDAIHAVEIVTDDKFRALTPENADQLVGDAAGLILPASFRSFPHAEHMARHPNLRVLSIAASGFDWLDIAAATRHNVVVTYSP